MFETMTFLHEAENRESFFQRIAILFPTRDFRYQLIEKAYNDAKDAFREIQRESGERYFEHIRAVSLILIDYLRVKDYRLIVAALLHDIVEDIPSWTLERIESEYGSKVALLVEYMTKPPLAMFEDQKSKRDEAYHSRFEQAPRVFFLIKLPDRWHNLITLWDCSPEKQKRKIEETYRHYLPYAEKHWILYHEILSALKALEAAT